MYDYIKNNQDCGIVSPTSYDEYNNLSYNSGKLPENENSNEILKVQGDVCVEKVLGSSMFVKMEDLQKVGMFNENLFIFFLMMSYVKKLEE